MPHHPRLSPAQRLFATIRRHATARHHGLTEPHMDTHATHGSRPPFDPPTPACDWCTTTDYTWEGSVLHDDDCPEHTNLWPVTQPEDRTVLCGICDRAFEDPDYGIRVPTSGDPDLLILCCMACVILRPAECL